MAENWPETEYIDKVRKLDQAVRALLLVDERHFQILPWTSNIGHLIS